MSISAVHEPLVVKLAVMFDVPEGPIGSARASFSLAHASRADPNVDAAVDNAARASRYPFAEDTKSE